MTFVRNLKSTKARDYIRKENYTGAHHFRGIGTNFELISNKKNRYIVGQDLNSSGLHSLQA
jgi:hypothetical protein